MQHLAVGTRYDEVCLVTLNGEVVKRIPCTARIDSLEYMSRSSTLLVPNRIPRGSGENAYLQLWTGDLSKVNCAVFHPGEKNSDITIARSSPCENYLFAGDHRNSNLFLFHLPSQSVVAEVPAFRDNLIDVAYSPDGKSLAAGYRNGAVQLLKMEANSDVVSVRPDSIFRAHTGEVLCTRFLSSNEVATCGSDGLIRIWNTSRAAEREPGSRGELWEGPRLVPWKQRLLNGANNGIRLSPDGSQILYSAANGILGIDARTGAVTQDHAVPGSGSAEWSSSGDKISLCFKSKVARFEVLDRTGKTIMTIPREITPRATAFSPSGDLIAIIDDREFRIYSAHDGSEMFSRPISGSGLSIAFSHDGTKLAYGGRFAGVQVVEPQSDSIARPLAGGWNTNYLAFSPDDSLLAAAQGDGVIRLWDTSTGRLRAELVGHERSVRDIAFSPDGRTLISASSDGTIRLWSVECASCFGTLSTKLDECRISLSADGRHFVIAHRNQDGKPEVLIWHKTSGRSLASHD